MNNEKLERYSSIINQLKVNSRCHKPSSPEYIHLESKLKEIGAQQLAKISSARSQFKFDLSDIGEIIWPFKSMGSVNTLDLLRVDELLMFSYYILNKDKYTLAIDLGANLGLHSLVLGLLGYNVEAYEPDPQHYEILVNNLSINNLKNVVTYNSAVGVKNGELQFLRIEGNTTSSHIKGAKENPYGEITEITVKCKEINSCLNPKLSTLMKVDVEGLEASLVTSILTENWQSLDAFVEVGSETNSEIIFDYCADIGLNIFVQQNNWKKCNHVTDMPRNYKDGSIFISFGEMNWLN